MAQLEDILERLVIIEEELHYFMGEEQIEREESQLLLLKEACQDLAALQSKLWEHLDMLKEERYQRTGQRYRKGEFEFVINS
jgi:hypothetical protein